MRMDCLFERKVTMFPITIRRWLAAALFTGVVLAFAVGMSFPASAAGTGYVS